MADVWDIAQYVETHPDDFEQRWRLAKKLYLAWEYRLALEHLQVLKNEWEDRPNVRRYLGATLFRLQRYDDAINELRDAARVWPDDVPIRQQLARVLAAADKPKDAAAVWTEILEIEPEHEFGPTVLAKLNAPKQPKPAERPRPRRSSTNVKRAEAPPPGAAPARRPGKGRGGEVVCQNCGARNGPDFNECWQCYGSLEYALPYEVPAEERIQAPPVRQYESPMPWVALGLSIVAMLSGGVYYTLLTMFPKEEPLVGARIPISIAEFYFFDMTMTRLVGGIILLLAWPLAFRIADYLLGLQTVDNRNLAASGVFLGAGAYLFAWLPSPFPAYGVAVLALISLVICVGVFKVRVHQGLLLWLVQGLIVLLVVGSVLAAFHGFDLIRDLPIVIRHAQHSDPRTVLKWSGTIPAESTVVWEKSDSSWLNRHANRIVIYAKAGPITRRVFIELDIDGKPLEFEQVTESGIRLEIDEIVPGTRYMLIASGEEGVPFEAEVRGMLPILQVGPETPTPPSDEPIASPTTPDEGAADTLDG